MSDQSVKDQNQISRSMAPLPLDVTLIVAATRSMGIGRAGTLPWTGLKQEMAYFARVTKRVPSSQEQNSLKNGVIMGRKTWDSIPEKFRPLKGRLNIVISRSASEKGFDFKAHDLLRSDGPIQLQSIPKALEVLKETSGLGKVFIIGGAEIYKAALALEEARRVLLTKVLSDFDCDTFFPIRLGGEQQSNEWRKCDKGELDEWTGEVVPEGEREESGTKYVFEMYEKARS